MTAANAPTTYVSVQAQPARAVDTVYQNTGTKPRFIAITAYASAGGANAAFLTDASNPPTTLVASMTNNTNAYNIVMFVIVLPGNYYKFYQQTGTWTISSWTEWTSI